MMNKKTITMLLILIFLITVFCGCMNQESTTVDDDSDEVTNDGSNEGSDEDNNDESDGGSEEGSDDIIGTWKGIEPRNPSGEWTIIFSENTARFTGPNENYFGTYTTDTSVTPHQIDFYITDCSISSYIGTTALGIYEVNGDTGKWCGGEPGKPNRPDSFNAEGSRYFDMIRESV
jgi:uncharacterized protein (TIGR03067 family)